MDIWGKNFIELIDICYKLKNFEPWNISQTCSKIGVYCNNLINQEDEFESKCDKFQFKVIKVIIKILKKLYGLLSIMSEFPDELGEKKHYKTIKNLGEELESLRMEVSECETVR